MEVISEQIKVKMDPAPEVLLKAHLIDSKEIITLEVYRGEETPYYYVGEGNYTAYVRIGNESVIATATGLKRLVLRGKNKTYDSLVIDYSFDDYSFSKLKAAYYKKTKKSMEMKDFESFGIVDKSGMLTNAGALLADESPIYCSRLFCTRWNGIDKASGVIDVYSDRVEHSARRFRADLPPFQSNLSALLSTPFRKSNAYLSGDECNDRFSIPPESLFRAL